MRVVDPLARVRRGRAGRGRQGGQRRGRREEVGDVQRLPQHSRLSGELPRGLQGAEDRRPERDYIVSALTDYRKGDRKHPTMRGVAGSLSDQDMADLAAYYEQLGKGAGEDPRVTKSADPTMDTPPPPSEVSKLLAKANCVSCHGSQLLEADRSVVSEARRPASRLPLRRAEGLPDRPQPALRPQQRDHDGHGAAVHAPRDPGARGLPRLAAERAEDGRRSRASANRRIPARTSLCRARPALRPACIGGSA